jgi:predicted DNA repair protein MutK
MAFGSLLTLFDDIASVLDDVSMMTKVATKKTAGVLGDDLALNAQQVMNSAAEREIPVVLAVMKGSFINKLILVPLALIISAFAHFLLTPLLMVGGAYLCFEGVEKVLEVIHKKRHPHAEHRATHATDGGLSEKDRIKGAIRTDFILSAEIVTIALGTMGEQTLAAQSLALAVVAVLMTVGVYGVVAGIVKLDDLGFWLTKKTAAALQGIGNALIAVTPYLMRALGIVGTIAMFLVGGGIIVHGIPALGHLLHHGSGWSGELVTQTANIVVGLLVGAVVVLAVQVAGKVLGKKPAAAQDAAPVWTADDFANATHRKGLKPVGKNQKKS